MTADPVEAAEGRAGASIAGAVVLIAISIAWVAWRASIPGDASPVIADPGFRHGLTVDPLPASGVALHPSDVVVAVGGVPIDRWLQGGVDSIPQSPAGLAYQVRRDGRLAVAAVSTGRHDVTSERLRADGGGPLAAIAILGLGGYATYRRRDAAAARALLLLGAGLLAYSSFTTFSYNTSDLVFHRAVFIVGFVGAISTLLVWSMAASFLALTFPQPVAIVRRHRRALLTTCAAGVVGVSATAIALLFSGTATLGRLDALTSVTSAILTVFALLTVAGLAHTLWAAWRDPALRSQCVIVAVGFAATALGLVIANLVAGDQKWPAWLDLVLFLPLPLAVTAAILRGEFLGIRAVLNRALVYTTLTALLLAVYAGAVLAVGAVVGRTGLARELVATAAVAIAFAPLRAALQRAVDNLLYGARGDRAHVLRAVGQRLEETTEPSDVLPGIAETVANALHLPYVAVWTLAADGMHLAAERGERDDDLYVIPLVHQGTHVGDLSVAARRGERSLSRTDSSVLADVARQVAPAIRAARLVTDLAASHNRLAVAREEERARLRHDLHDRLGPHLVGLSLQLDRLSGRLPGPDTSASVTKAHEEAMLALDEVRRISRGLRPAELEELGLVQAINAAAARLSIADDDSGWSVSVDAAVQLGTIPPDVESAAYQIALEGLTNAYRHSAGRGAWIRVGVTAAGSALIVEVTDDGTGIDDSRPAGIGIRSMHTRAEAVGGNVAVTGTAAHGTTVRASLPLHRADGLPG